MKTIRLESAGSTNREAFLQLKHHAPIAVIAGQQTDGRGRGNNTWLSPPGNLYLSLGDILPAAQLPGLSVRVAVHLVRLLNPHMEGNALRIKWPNDLMDGDKKAGGILVESRIQASKAITVAGIGINIQHAPLEGAAVIGDRLGMSTEQLEAGVMSTIHAAMHDPIPEKLVVDLHRLSWLVSGDHVRFEENGRSLTGVFEGYNPDLTLRVTVNRQLRSLAGSQIHRIRKEDA